MPILLLRHGNTTYDAKVDALLDPPLTFEGVERIKRSAEFLKDHKLDRIVSSPLQRAMKAAELVSCGNLTVIPDNRCLPWNLGDFMGKLGKAVDSKIQLYEDYPDLKVPHGESYRRFYDRWTGFLEKLMAYVEAKNETVLVVTHSRNINALQSFINGNPIGDVTEVTPEASVTLLAKTGSGVWSYKQIWEGK